MDKFRLFDLSGRVGSVQRRGDDGDATERDGGIGVGSVAGWVDEGADGQVYSEEGSTAVMCDQRPFTALMGDLQ